jgi:hypothetical protein
MRGIRPTLTLPIAALAACLLASGAAISQSPFDDLELEKVDLCPEAGGPCGTVRLKGVDIIFDFKDHRGNNIGYSWQCYGLKYPEQPWPANCSVTLRGPEIDKRFGQHAGLEFDGPKTIWIRTRDGDRVLMSKAKRVTTASILPGRGCVDGGKCVATFLGYGERIFDFKNKSGDTFGYVYKCEVGVDFPAKPWPAGCSIHPAPIEQREDRSDRDKIEECSPVCVVKEH